ncbi:MAG: N-6 DNA methylase [Nitrososphaerales archaeon]
MKWRFGPYSPTYSLAIDVLRSLWVEVEEERDAKLKLDLWAKNMEIVYGSKPELESFIAHTYLVTLVKLIVYLRLSGDNTAKEDKIRSALSGEYFSSYGIANLIEEDFFAWILHPKIIKGALNLTCGLVKELLRYDFSQIDEDFFKEIYQEIVERGERHRIGEYYTPEWLTELTLKEAIKLWREKNEGLPRILDAFCGSGTFLCNAVHWMKNELINQGVTLDKALDIILNNIVGVDINPLAVTIARANYLIALGDLLKAGKTVVIPVYVSDSIKIPKVGTVWEYHSNENVEVYDIEANDIHIQIPSRVAKHRPTLGIVLKGFKEAVEAYRARKNRDEAYEVFKRTSSILLSQGELGVFRITLDNILSLIDKKQDAIWIFLINNMYAPVALMESKFDLLVSNPPWIAMRYIENKSYQDFLKSQVLHYELLKSDQVELFTHMEAATLCYCRSADLYLKDGGITGFVLPRSVLTGALHHTEFKALKHPSMKLLQIFDLEDVSPLFNVPSCVLISIKGGKTSYPVSARRFAGRLPEKNLKLNKAKNYLRVEDYRYKPHTIQSQRSYYYGKMREGATLVPRCMWFIDFVIHEIFGINIRTPLVKTSDEAVKEAKDPWKSINLEGNIEADFIYATLLSKDVVPFGYVKLRPIVLPIEPIGTGYRLLDVNALRNRGFAHMAEWLEKTQKLWAERRTEKAVTRFSRVINRLDYNGLLSIQNPSKRYVVLYNASGTNIASCVIDKQSLPDFEVLKAKVKPRGFVVYSKSFFYETNDMDEAHYICAVLNSKVINDAIKPLQPRGLWGEREIQRRPFMFPIRRFDRDSKLHVHLAELGKRCHAKVSLIKFTKKGTAGLRKEAREAVKKELEEIDKLVSELLGL